MDRSQNAPLQLQVEVDVGAYHKISKNGEMQQETLVEVDVGAADVWIS